MAVSSAAAPINRWRNVFDGVVVAVIWHDYARVWPGSIRVRGYQLISRFAPRPSAQSGPKRQVVCVVAKPRRAVLEFIPLRDERIGVDPECLGGVELRKRRCPAGLERTPHVLPFDAQPGV